MRAAVTTALLGLLALGLSASAGARPHTASAGLVVTLKVQSPTAHAGQPWRFTLRAVDARGHAVKGAAIVRVVAFGQTLDRIGQFGIVGQLSRTYNWSPTLGGSTATLVATVVTANGTRTTHYDVRVSADTGHPQFTVTLAGSGHAVRAGAPWHFAVRALDAKGKSIQGTAIVRVVSGTRIVDTVGWFGFKQRLVRPYSFNPILRGTVARMQAKVIGPGGTRIVAYAVRVS